MKTEINTLESVRAKIVAMVPDLMTREHCGGCECLPENHDNTITLADVLRALGNSREIHGLTFDVYAEKLVIFWSTKDGDGATLKRTRWNLSKSLDEQEPEVIEFIGKVLGIS